MPTLTRKSFNAYRKNLDAVEERAVRGFVSKIKNVAELFKAAEEGEQRSVYRSYIIDDVYGRIDLATAQAQALADDMFEALTGAEPAPHEAFPYEAAEARVRSSAVHLFKWDDEEEFARVLESFIRQEVRGAASNAIAENVEEANR